MSLRKLEQRVVFQEQQALDLTLVSTDRLRADEVQVAWNEARALESDLRSHGEEALELMGRLGSVMVELMCADQRVAVTPHKVAAA